MTQCTSDVTATLLYGGGLPVIDDCLGNHLTSQGFEQVETGWTDGAFVVTWAAVPSPCPAADFTGALNSAYMQDNHGGLGNAVERHRNHIRLCVHGSGSLLDRLTLLHALACCAARAAMPMALHWPASGQLLTGPQYMDIAGVTHPWALFVRPVISPAGMDAEGRTLHRLALIGAEDFIGVGLTLAPSPLDRAEMLRIALGSLQRLVETGAAPQTGTMLASSRTARIEGHCVDGHMTLTAHCRARALPAARAPVDTTNPRASKLRRAIAATGIAAAVALCIGLASQVMQPPAVAYSIAKIDVSVLPAAN
ncbi:hypothetical protein ACP2AV_12125 [Aliiroseovarius sp. PTFE2010]|uniref:hypothetical protein n=1 Tax=Aliiroseovarius sp. PTFE2010 TaxID=3417190 RepID=UPI003CF4885C